jgi:hypothetical protein
MVKIQLLIFNTVKNTIINFSAISEEKNSEEKNYTKNKFLK